MEKAKEKFTMNETLDCAQHTPGPWMFDIKASAKMSRDIGRNTGYLIHPESQKDCSQKALVANAHGLANARLIAAAPDLLDAVTKCHDAIKLWRMGHSFPNTDLNAAFDAARAVIGRLEDGHVV